MFDRIAVRFTLIIFAVLAMSQGCARLAHAERSDGFVEGDYCDPDDRAGSWTHEQKQRTRERVWAACKRVGGPDLYCKFWDAAVVRESSGVASRVHVLGQDSDGRSERRAGTKTWTRSSSAGLYDVDGGWRYQGRPNDRPDR